MKTVLPVLFVMIVGGSSQSHVVGRSETDTWLPTAQHDLLDESATVTTSDGRSERGKVIALTADSVVLRHGDDTIDMVFVLDSVTTIKTSGSKIAPILGALFGATAGVLIGSTTGAGASSPGREVEETFGGGAVGGFAGALVGTLFLAQATKGHYYQLQEEPSKQLQKPSKMITLKLASLQDETPEAVSIIWKGRVIWLPKSAIVLDRSGGSISLTVPAELLERK